MMKEFCDLDESPSPNLSRSRGSTEVGEMPCAVVVHVDPAARAASRLIAKVMGTVIVNQVVVPRASYGFLPPHLENFPVELRNQHRWVVWRAEGAIGTKPTKVPYDPTLLNFRAKSNDSQTWGTFEQALAAYSEGGYTGLGFMLNGDGLVGVDIDHCVVDGDIAPAAQDLMENLGATYVEISPSGTGLRAFGYADLLAQGVNGKFGDLKVELYSDVRFLTVTGHVLRGGALSQMTGFAELANSIRANSGAKPVGSVPTVGQEERHTTWMNQVISGEVYHDSLRDLAGSLIASGAHPGAVVSMLRGLMHSSLGPHDGRWRARMDEIPKLVDSALKKYSPGVVDVHRIMQSAASAANVSTPPNRFKVLSATEIARSAPIEWTVRALLPKTGLAALYGPSGSGKSFLALDLGASIAAGDKEWYGMRIAQCPVTYCVLEGEAGMGKRVAAWETYTQKDIADNLRFIAQPFDITVAADVEELAAAIRAAGGADGLIVLDTLNRAAPGADENSSKDMGEIIANVKALQQLTGGLVLLVHHTGKDETKGMRGHSSLFAAMDAVVGVLKSKGDVLSWCVAKSKDDVTGTIHPFRLEQVVVGTDAEGEEITSCVAVSVAPPFALRKKKKLGVHQETALQALKGLLRLHGTNAPGISLETAIQAAAVDIAVGPKHKRLRAKEAIEALAFMEIIEITDTYICAGTKFQ